MLVHSVVLSLLAVGFLLHYLSSAVYGRRPRRIRALRIDGRFLMRLIHSSEITKEAARRAWCRKNGHRETNADVAGLRTG